MNPRALIAALIAALALIAAVTGAQANEAVAAFRLGEARALAFVCPGIARNDDRERLFAIENGIAPGDIARGGRLDSRITDHAVNAAERHRGQESEVCPTALDDYGPKGALAIGLLQAE